MWTVDDYMRFSMQHLTKKEKDICFDVMFRNRNCFVADDEAIETVAKIHNIPKERVERIFYKCADRAKRLYDENSK